LLETEHLPTTIIVMYVFFLFVFTWSQPAKYIYSTYIIFSGKNKGVVVMMLYGVDSKI
jgi:hypothetical protein